MLAYRNDDGAVMAVFKASNGSYSIYKRDKDGDSFVKTVVPIADTHKFLEEKTRSEAEYMLRYICENKLRDKTYKEVTL